MAQNSDARKTLKELVDGIKSVFKKHSRTARERAWDALTSPRAKEKIQQAAKNPSITISNSSSWLSYREWVEQKSLCESTIQISRKDFYEILRWLSALKVNYGINCRPGTDISQGGFPMKTNDPKRLIRIFQWALNEIKKIEQQLGGNLTPDIKSVQSGMYDKNIVPILSQINSIVRSAQHNFQQVGFQHDNTDKVIKMLDPYSSIL